MFSARKSLSKLGSTFISSSRQQHRHQHQRQIIRFMCLHSWGRSQQLAHFSANQKRTQLATVTSPLQSLHSIRFNHGTNKRVTPFIMPDIGEGIKEVKVKEWFVKVGDEVREFDDLCEVESDKAVARISSRYNGIITRLYYEVDEEAAVGQPLVDIQQPDSGDQLAPHEVPAGANNADQKENPPVVASQKTGSETVGDQQPAAALPSVRRLAKENNIDLSKVKASGRFGRISKEDLLNYMSSSSSATTRAVDNNIQTTTKQQLTSPAATGSRSEPVESVRQESRLALRGIQRAMFKNMTQSLRIPHFNYSDEIDMTNLVQFVALQKQSGQQEKVVSSFAFIIKMVSLALLEYPQLNASLDEQQLSTDGELVLIQKHYHNIGVAVDTPSGLIVPNIKNVERLSVVQVNEELRRLRGLAYDSKLSPNDLSGATMSLSNIGAIGGLFGVPVIVTPEIIIGALGRTRQLPRFNACGQVEARHIMQLVWSADHRLVDGATLSRFSNLLKSFLEQPEAALMRLT